MKCPNIFRKASICLLFSCFTARICSRGIRKPQKRSDRHPSFLEHSFSATRRYQHVNKLSSTSCSEVVLILSQQLIRRRPFTVLPNARDEQKKIIDLRRAEACGLLQRRCNQRCACADRVQPLPVGLQGTYIGLHFVRISLPKRLVGLHLVSSGDKDANLK